MIFEKLLENVAKESLLKEKLGLTAFRLKVLFYIFNHFLWTPDVLYATHVIQRDDL